MSLNEFPLVSVITPTYNRADFLSETIQSVLSQDYPHFEYIVLDDGSKDNTHEVLSQYHDARMFWESHPNMGESRTVNKGLAIAKGEFIIVVNSDDPILHGLLRVGVEFMKAYPDILVAYPDWIMIDEHSQKMQDVPMYDYHYAQLLQWHYCHIGPGAIIRRRALELESQRSTKYRYVADYEFWLRVGLHGPMARIPKQLATWRSHSGAATLSSANRKIAQEHIEVIKDYYQHPNLPTEVLQVKKEAICNAYYIAASLCLPKYRLTALWYFARAFGTLPFFRRCYPNVVLSWELFFRIIIPRVILRFLKAVYLRLRKFI